MHIQIVVFDGFDELDAIAPFEVLQNAAALGADFQLEFVSRAEEVTGGHGLKMRPDAHFPADHAPDLLLVPGGGWGDSSAVAGVRQEVQRREIPTAIASMHRSGAIIAGVCTGAMLMAAAGILVRRPAVTHHVALTDLRAAGVQIIRARVVDDGDVVTSGGVTSGLDLALWLVERFASAKIAEAVAERMEYERRGIVWRARVPA